MTQRRSLVLDTRRLVRLRIDGPALSIHLHEQSRQWFPLRRLGRILCIGLPQHGFDALLHCAAAGIPVTFLSPRGHVRGQLSHPANLPSPLSHWLDAVDYEPDLALAWEHWRESILRHWYAMIGCMQGNLEERARAADAELNRIARRERRLPLLQLSRRWIQGFLTAQIGEHCGHWGLSESSRWRVRLQQELEPALAALAQAALLQCWPRHRIPNSENLARFFHGRFGARVDERIRQALTTLATALESSALGHDAPKAQPRPYP